MKCEDCLIAFGNRCYPETGDYADNDILTKKDFEDLWFLKEYGDESDAIYILFKFCPICGEIIKSR